MVPYPPPPPAQAEHFIEDFLPNLLARASHAVSAEFHARLRSMGISVQEWRVLAALSATDGETVSGLAETCLQQQPTMTKLLDRMVRDRLVSRRPDGRDRRVVRVSLTEKGQATLDAVLDAAQRHETEVLARQLGSDTEAIKSALRILIDRHGRPRRT